MLTLTNITPGFFSNDIARLRDISQSDVKHQVRNLAEIKCSYLSGVKHQAQNLHLFAYYTSGCINIKKLSEKNDVVGDVFVSNGFIDG